MPIKEDEEDFNVPISKHFKLARRSFHDFDVVQLNSLAQLQPLPAHAFSLANGGTSDPPVEPVAERSPPKVKSKPKKQSSEPLHDSAPAAKLDDEGKLKVDQEQVKSGCNCHLL